jgi:CubicO group peptidase (beta-lactamase class C family)
MPVRRSIWIGTLCAFVILGSVLASSTYLRRYVLFGMADVWDYEQLPSRLVEPAAVSFVFREAEAPLDLDALGLAWDDVPIDDAESFLEDHGTTAFLVIQADTILYEGYFNEFERSSLYKSFSISKSVLSALVGIALEAGDLSSVDLPLTRYVPEMRDPRAGEITLQHLLDNTAGLHYVGGFLPWTERPRMYYSPGVRELLYGVQVEVEPGSRFQPEELSPLLLGVVLERATGKTISEYTQSALWQPMGARFAALWNIDSVESGLEKTESGFCARAIDLARFAHLYLKQGRWLGRQIVPQEWVQRSTAAVPEGALNGWPEGWYRNLWWGARLGKSPEDFYANGHFGQRLYVSPTSRAVVVRLGFDRGGVHWEEIAGRIAEALAAPELPRATGDPAA